MGERTGQKNSFFQRKKGDKESNAYAVASIQPSTKRNKRFQVILENGDIYHFGLLNPVHGTYIDHGNKELRYRYWARHYGNAKERELIDNLTPSASVYSAYILWGDHKDIKKNIRELNKLIA
jgi:hypothetical protein